MSETPIPPSTPAPRMTRPRPLFLALAALVLVLVLIYVVWPAASPSPAPSNPARVQQRAAAPGGQAGKGGRGDLEVRLGELLQPPPPPSDADRNPFRFKPKPPPPPPPAPPRPANQVPVAPPVHVPGPGEPGYVPPPPPPPPPITLKFIGTLEQGNKRVAIFSDGQGLPVYAPEGGTVLGRYRVVRIGVESVTLEYLDGRGRQQIPMRGGQ